MAEPGDPPAPEDPTAPPCVGDNRLAEPAPDVAPVDPPGDWDDEVGFTSPAAMAGRPRDTLSINDPPADAVSAPNVETPVESDAPPRIDAGSGIAGAASEPPPAWAVETPVEARPAFGRAAAPEPIDGAMWAYTIYALILFAVPTLGVSAIIGILAVTGRAAPDQAVARSHYVFQQRTLWAAAVAALAGVILIVVNLGVFVLFALAVWTLVRGAVGVMKLKAGRPIDAPHNWFL